MGTSLTPVVWIFQVTTSTTHKGSKQGWPIIGHIAHAATERTKELVEYKNNHPLAPEALATTGSMTKFTVGKVKVIYVLVRPYPLKGCSWTSSWTMPEGRTKSLEGDVFCLFFKV